MLSEEQLGAFMYQMKVSGNFMSLVTQILVLTAVRTGELRLATWDEIDFTNALWVIPKERMKMRRPHVVPLSHQTQMLLKEIKIITAPRNSELVILVYTEIINLVVAVASTSFFNKLAGIHSLQLMVFGILSVPFSMTMISALHGLNSSLPMLIKTSCAAPTTMHSISMVVVK